MAADATATPLPQLPWLATPLSTMRQMARAGRWPQALLIHEAPGCGGAQFASTIAQLALCRSIEAPCGHCASCMRVTVRQHPDLHWLTVEEDRKQIRVEQVRELIAELQLTSHERGRRVAVIEPADAMTTSTANALLKTLEEPSADAMIMLVTTMPSALPATVRSRCQRLAVTAPSRADCLAWLREQRGEVDWQAVLAVTGLAPLRALAVDPALVVACHAETAQVLHEAARGRLNIPAVAGQWAEQDYLPLRLACIETWVTTWLERALRARGQCGDLQTAAHLQARNSELNIPALLRVLAQVRQLAGQLSSPLNKALALEQLFWQARTAEN